MASHAPKPALKQFGRLLRFVPMPPGAGSKAMSRLMVVYNNRPDLQEVFPEAQDGNFHRLINWAAGVATKQFTDSAFATLAPSAIWYCANRNPDALEAPSPWPGAVATAAASRNAMPVTLATMQDPIANDISHHLLTMALLVNEFDLRNVVELGTRDGNSTLALLEAVKGTDGSVLSIDIDACDDAKRRVKEAGLNRWWKFIQADDMNLDESVLPDPIDLLFIDTSHLYAHTLAELNKFRWRLRDGAWILLHDYVEFPGVRKAVQEFIESLPHKPSFYPFVHQNGLAVIRVRNAAATK